MKEITVKTTGNFMLLDRHTGREIPANGVEVTVPHSPFITERLELKQLVEIVPPAPKPAKPKPAKPKSE